MSRIRVTFSHSAAALSLLVLMFLASMVKAQEVSVWLSRDQVTLGETVTLNIKIDSINFNTPDYSQLHNDFQINGQTSSRSMNYDNNVIRHQTLLGVVLSPKRTGVLKIPSFFVVGQKTKPLTLTVTQRNNIPEITQQNADIFIRSEIDVQRPYVHQAVRYALRLYTAIPLGSGRLEQEPPEGASLQRIGKDVQYRKEISGRYYNVIERLYLLIPGQSGKIVVPGATFQGQRLLSGFNSFFQNSGRDVNVQAHGNTQSIQVQAIPNDAPQPWLPLYGLSLRYIETPQNVRSGEAASIVVEMVADGVTASQLPELRLQTINGTHTFADPPQFEELFTSEIPRVKVTRKFLIVPETTGMLHIRGWSLDWWNVNKGMQQTSALPDLEIQVTQGDDVVVATTPPDISAPAGPIEATTMAAGEVDNSGHNTIWVWLTVALVLIVLWIGTLLWVLRGRSISSAKTSRKISGSLDKKTCLSQLRRALDDGALDVIHNTLYVLVPSPIMPDDDLSMRLSDVVQQDAVKLLQSARWGKGDIFTAQKALRKAFIKEPQWRKDNDLKAEKILPSLYP